ncbi:uncharacterized protein [Haliotis cracherodii]|uniref:uncharacterized protein n=1 Tax=Haliotis cracherodii TaxID=6455 RepID=UPI0039ECFE69
MFGHHPRLPVDLAFGLDMQPSKPKSLQQYTKSLRDRLQEASHNSKEAQQDQKTNFDKKASAAVIETGDRVLVKTVAFEGRHNLADRWEERRRMKSIYSVYFDVYVVLRHPNPSIPVFEVGKENGEGRNRVLHRNLLLPVSSLPVKMPPTIKPRRRQVPIPVPKPRKNTAVETSEDMSDEESAIGYTRSSEPSVPTEITVERPTEGESEEALEGDETPTEEGREEKEHTDDTVHQNKQDEDRSETGATGSEDDREEQTNLQPEDASQPRRSTRTRSQPSWMRSGEYVLSAISDPGNPEWLARANYLNSLLADDRFRDQRHRVADTLLDHVNGKVK